VTAEIDRAGMADRCAAVGGDARLDVPTADVYLFRMVLCDFPDPQAAAVLRAARRAAPLAAELVIIDRIRRPGATDPAATHAAMSTLNLMVMTGAAERTQGEYGSLLHHAGWTLTDSRPLTSGGPLHYLSAVTR